MARRQSAEFFGKRSKGGAVTKRIAQINKQAGTQPTAQPKRASEKP